MASPLFTRWFQSQVFSPGFRMHLVPDDANAPWQGPAPSQKVLVDFIRLRRRLAPYADSCGAGLPVSKKEAATRSAPATLNDYSRAGEHLHALAFGPAILVQPAPATETHLLRLALPSGSTWIDFWTGAAYSGGQVLRTPAPVEILPIFVRAGSIVPMAPLEQKDGEPEDPVEVRVYPGSDGSFTLQDKTGPITFAWNDRANTLRIGGPVPCGTTGALRRRFHVVVVRTGRGIGLHSPTRPDGEVAYSGAELHLALPPAPPRPLAPKGLAASVEGGHLVISWQAPCASAVYRLKRVVGPGGIYEDLASALPAPRHVIPLSAIDQPFECVVTAMNAGGESSPSAPVKVTASAATEKRKSALRPALAPQPSRGFCHPEIVRQTQPAPADLVAGARSVWTAPSSPGLVASRSSGVHASNPLYPLAKAS